MAAARAGLKWGRDLEVHVEARQGRGDDLLALTNPRSELGVQELPFASTAGYWSHLERGRFVRDLIWLKK